MKHLSYARSKVTARPTQKQIDEAIAKAQEIKLTESARMQFPKTENY